MTLFAVNYFDFRTEKKNCKLCSMNRFTYIKTDDLLNNVLNCVQRE